VIVMPFVIDTAKASIANPIAIRIMVKASTVRTVNVQFAMLHRYRFFQKN